jgi:hypothetical protein
LFTICSLAGCPVAQRAQQANTTPPTGQTTAQQPNAAAQVAPTQPETSTPATPIEGNWVRPVQATVGVNQLFQVEFRLVPVSTGEAWVALVPSAVTSTIMADNVQQAVDRVTLPLEETGEVDLSAKAPGTYMIRLFPVQTGEVMAISEAAITVVDHPVSDEMQFTPPYVTITSRELKEVPEQGVGRPMIAYWELEAAPGEKAWIGMVPTSCTAQDAKSNLAAAVDLQYLKGQTKDRSVFFLAQPGEYVFRLFPSEDAQAQMICESQVFRVKPKADASKPEAK